MLSDLDEVARQEIVAEVLVSPAAIAAIAAGIDVGLTLRNMMRSRKDRLEAAAALMRQSARLTGRARLLRRM